MSCGWKLCLLIHRCFSFLHVLLFFCMYFLFTYFVYFVFVLYSVFLFVCFVYFAFPFIFLFHLHVFHFFFSAIFVSLPMPKTSKPAEMWSLVKKRGNATVERNDFETKIQIFNTGDSVKFPHIWLVLKTFDNKFKCQK